MEKMFLSGLRVENINGKKYKDNWFGKDKAPDSYGNGSY
jgi:hypothetical protein